MYTDKDSNQISVSIFDIIEKRTDTNVIYKGSSCTYILSTVYIITESKIVDKDHNYKHHSMNILFDIPFY